MLRVFVGTLLLLSTVASAAETGTHVVMISLDGFPAWLWRDPSLPVPNLRKLAANGAAAQAMIVSNPSITWINHTTLVTGVNPRKHGVLFNGLLVRQGENKAPKIEQWAPKDQLVHVPTLYDLAHQAGLSTAEVDWVAVKDAKTIDWSFPELPSAAGKVEKEMIAAGSLTAEQCTWMNPGPQRKNMAWHDSTWTAAARHIIERHKPNILLYHLLNTDAVHHQYGPGSMASYTALSYADRLVGDLVDSIGAAGLLDSTTFVVTTDHGFKKVSKYAYPNIVLRKAGYLEAFGPTITRCDVAAMAQGGMAFIYVTNAARRADLLPKLREMFTKAEGVAQVVDGNDAPALGMPKPDENPGMGDLVLFAKEGYAFNAAATGDAAVGPTTNYAGTHGYPNSDPELDGIFIISGRGIKKGVTLERMTNLDVAPTVARLLGLKLPDMDGRVLEQVLEEP